MSHVHVHEIRHLTRDGVRLAYVEAGPAHPSQPPILLIHGWMADHGIFGPQLEHLSRMRRVVAVHLRGHGASDKPEQEYTIRGYADDVAWQCHELRLDRPLLVATSMGGVIALEAAGRYPALACGLVMIDTAVLPPPAFVEAALKLSEAFRRPDYLEVARAQAYSLYGPHVDPDDPDRRERILAEVLDAHRYISQQAAVSSFVNWLRHDSLPAAQACRVPMAYLDSGHPAIVQGRDLVRLRKACPQLMIAKVLGAGHFSSLEVPDQVNAMIDRFMAVAVAVRPRTDQPV